MKRSSLLSSLCIGVMLTGCGSAIKNLDCYRFKTGSNFHNAKFKFERPVAPNFENEFENQALEINNSADEIIDFDNIKDKKVTIKNGGTYRLTGKSTNCSIEIDADGVVNLVFDNLNITSIGGTPIKVKKAKVLNIHVNSKTKNYVCDSQTNDNKAAIYASCDVNIDGKGFLFLNSYGKNEDLIDYGKCIYTSSDLNIKDTRIIVQLSTGSTFEVEGNTFIDNAKIEIRFSVGGGIVTTGNLNINDSLFIYTGSMDAIESRDFTALNSNFYIYTVGNYQKVNLETEKLDFNDIYYVKDDKDFYRVDPAHYDNTKVLYKLNYSTKGVLTHGEANFVNSRFNLDTDDDSISALGNLTSTNSHYFIKSSNQGVVTEGTLNFINENEKDDFPIKIFESYVGLKGEIINFDGASTFVDSNNSGVESFGENGNIVFKNEAKMIVNTDVFGLISEGDIDIDHSFVSIFGGEEGTSQITQEEAKINTNEGVLVIAQNKNLPALIPEVNQNTISLYLKDKIKKNDVIHLKSKNKKFFSSLIVPKVYENLMVTISSNLISKDRCEVSKGGLVDYKFIQDMSIMQGLPEEDEILTSLLIDKDFDNIYQELK